MAKKKFEGELPSVFDMVKSIDKTAEIIADSSYSNINDWIPTGSYVLNACMSGDMFKAIPTGRVTTFYGPSSVGKSFLCCSAAREAQKKGYTVIYMDSEGAIDSKFVARLGVDPTKLIIKQVTTIAETSQFIANTCKALADQEEQYGTHQKVMMVLDSLGNLTSDKERQDTMDGNNKRDLTKAQEVKALFRVNATAMARMQVPLVVSNHSYACFSGDTLVVMGDGSYKEIKDIEPGDEVMTMNEPELVHERLEYDGKECYELEFNDGMTVKCTPNHQFLTKDKEGNLVYKSAEDLTEEDEIVVKDNNSLKLKRKSIVNDVDKVYDIEVNNEHHYILKNGIVVHNCIGAYVPTQVQASGTGIVYNSSVTIELSAAKLEDKDNDKAASMKQGADTTTKNGVLVTAKPSKSRFCRPYKVKFQIPYFKAPNPYVGLETFMNWDNAGVARGNILNEKEFAKLSPAEQAKVHKFEFNGETLYCQEKETARGIVVKHLGQQVSLVDFYSDKVFTPEYLEYLNTNVIHPMFDLPDQSSFDDVKDLEESLGIEDDAEESDVEEMN